MTELERVKKLADKLAETDAEVKRLEEELKTAKRLRTQLEMEDLPMLMDEIGLHEMVLESGERIKLVEDCNAKIPACRSDEAMKWLNDNGFGGMIKTVVSVEFDRGDVDAANEVADKLRQDYPTARAAGTVHWQTLKSFVKEQLEKGANLPHELLGIHTYTKAVIRK